MLNVYARKTENLQHHDFFRTAGNTNRAGGFDNECLLRSYHANPLYPAFRFDRNHHIFRERDLVPNFKFLIAAKTSLKLVQRKLDEVRGVMVSRPYYSSKYGLYYDSSQTLHTFRS